MLAWPETVSEAKTGLNNAESLYELPEAEWNGSYSSPIHNHLVKAQVHHVRAAHGWLKQAPPADPYHTHGNPLIPIMQAQCSFSAYFSVCGPHPHCEASMGQQGCLP